MRLPVLFAGALRPRLLEAGLMSEAELDEVIAGCEQIAQDPETWILTFAVSQVWGRKPAG
jgi:hypothetical protein